MYMCGTRFEIEEEELALIRSLSSQDLQEEAIIEEEKSDQKEEFEPISDHEEEEEGVTQLGPLKRHRSVSSEPSTQTNESEQGEDDVYLLPQPRSSGRARKRSRLLDGYELS